MLYLTITLCFSKYQRKVMKKVTIIHKMSHIATITFHKIFRKTRK